ncbi:hypothetical protein L226DRAFT_316758 [Lentinus tigrinus ALCF2SS1-7]|uniref:uncharacterized protein n=1 Tax=Lentinus tigrinus ALCF2SS1-7 TaxID=1328758 RepID=UPI00116615C4|nr:hypothetical protein L226DRAFT_316758 [Lentinus tigrinus ALCF2SS1-7]
MGDTTVLMTLRQFQQDQLLDLASHCDHNHQFLDHARSVWWTLQNEFGNIPHQPYEKSFVKEPSAREVADAWTRADSKIRVCPGHFLPECVRNPKGEYGEEYKLYGTLIHEEDRDELNRGYYTRWAFLRFAIIFRGVRDGGDCYDDSPIYDGSAVKRARTAVGDAESAAQLLFSYQQRTAAFLLLVNIDEFRVMRWDRSGVIITEPVNYLRTIEGTRALLEVTYAFSKFSRARLGMDTTAVRLMEASCGWKRMDLLAQPSPDDLSYAEALFDRSIHEVFIDANVAATYGSFSPDANDTDLHYDPTHSCHNHVSSPPVIPVLEYIRNKFRESLVSGFPRYRLTVDGHDYLVGRPFFTKSGVVNRGTRGYIALEWETQRLVFLKDSWRVCKQGAEHEGAILSKLNEHGVQNIPTVVRYGDVCHVQGDLLEQMTETSDYHPVSGGKHVDLNLAPFADDVEKTGALEDVEQWFNAGTEQILKHPALEGLRDTVQLPLFYGHDSGPCPHAPKKAASMPDLPAFLLRPKPLATATAQHPRSSRDSQAAQGKDLLHLMHTRLVVKEICLPFTEFTSTRQLVHLIFDCVIAHGLAYKRCQYIHCDISEGNLLIYPHIRRTDKGVYGVSWRGMLSDWECAKTKTTTSDRLLWGNWDFMSAYRLLNLNEPATIPDELESFVHVLIYCAVFRVQSNIHPHCIKYFLEYYFSEHLRGPSGNLTCPRAKLSSLVCPGYLGPRLTMSGVAIIFSTPGRQLADQHTLNQLIQNLFNLFHSRYAIDAWERKESDRRTQPSQATYAKRASLEHHFRLANTLHHYSGLPKHVRAWPVGDVIPNRKDEELHTDEPSPAYDEEVTPQELGLFQLEDDQEAQKLLAELKPDSPPAEAVAPQTGNRNGEPAEPQNAPNAPDPDASSRPAKRRRLDPVVDEAALLRAESSTQRVTRSRSAAQAVAADFTRVTRSKTGKLPSQVAAAASAVPSASRGSDARTTTSRRRGGAASRNAPSKSRGR